MSDSEEEIEVKVFLYRGKKYYIQETTGDVFDIKTNEFIGKYNKKTKEIVEDIDEEEEEKEDEYDRQERMAKEEQKKFELKEKERLAREYENDDVVPFRKGNFSGFKSSRTNRVYTFPYGKPYGMYDPNTRRIDTTKKPEPIFSEDEEEEEEEKDPDTEVEEEDDDEIEVKPFTHDGIKYFIDPKTNKLYDPKTDILIGRWNNKKKVIEELSNIELDDLIDDLSKEIDAL